MGAEKELGSGMSWLMIRDRGAANGWFLSV